MTAPIFFILLALYDIGGFSSSKDEKLRLRGVGLVLGIIGIILLFAYFALPYIIVGVILLAVIFIFGLLGKGKF